MIVTADGTTAVVSDPHGDRVFLVDLERVAVRDEVALRPGDEPGRLAEDGSGRVHVALRRGGAVLTIALDSGQIVGRQEVCRSPRGIAWDTSISRLYVACAGGELLSLAPGGGVHESIHLEPDLRDVVVADGRLLVSRFRRAELIQLDRTLHVTGRVRPPPATIDGVIQRADGTTGSGEFGAAVGWRLVAAANRRGGAWLLHQRGADFDLGARTSVMHYYGMPIEVRDQVRSIVVASASHVDIDGNIGPTPILPGSLPIDVAESADGDRLAFVMAGEDDVIVANEDYVRHAVRLGVGGEGMFAPQLLSRTHLAGPVAVAWSGDRLVVQFRSPAAVAVFRPEEPDKPVEDERFVLLGDPLPADPGHEAFHASTGLGLACASCHPEGAEDGRVWQFEEGRRRTQPLYGGVLQTAPFHWGGELVSLDTIVDEVFVTRMGGSLADMDREGLARWLDGIPAPVGMEAGDPASIEHGRELFAARGCDSCHSGPHFTDNRSHDVGTGGRMQTPMLLGLGERAPYLHDGCAQTLQDRFERCHTVGHGNLGALSAAEVNDFVDYLRTL